MAARVDLEPIAKRIKRQMSLLQRKHKGSRKDLQYRLGKMKLACKYLQDACASPLQDGKATFVRWKPGTLLSSASFPGAMKTRRK